MEQYNKDDGIYRFSYDTTTKEMSFLRSAFFDYNGGKLEMSVEAREGCKNADCSKYDKKIITERDKNGEVISVTTYDSSGNIIK